MKIELFNRLYFKALEYNGTEMYIAERGWQEWMEDYAGENDEITGENIVDALTRVHFLAHMTLKEMREETGLSQRKFGAAYSIPARTVENWEMGVNAPPPYVKMLIAYTLL